MDARVGRLRRNEDVDVGDAGVEGSPVSQPSRLKDAVDAVVDKLYRQIKRYRGKRIKSRRGGAGTVEEMALGEPLPLEIEEADIEDEAAIVRRKSFPLRPMAPEEAIEQMELLGHSFYVFFDVDDEMVNVIYKRHDGNYGLLQPEFD